MAYKTLLVDRSCPGLAVLTLNRPAKLNALSHDMLLALEEAITDLQNAGTVLVSTCKNWVAIRRCLRVSPR